MRALSVVGLLGVALLWGCSERSQPTALRSNADLNAAGVIGDRPYTWSLKCSGDFSSAASWSWTTGGTPIAGATGAVDFCFPGQIVSGGGVRPALADGFNACVNYRTCQSWSFDPTGAFKAQLKGDISSWNWVRCGQFDPFQSHPASCFNKATATLHVES